MRGLGERLGPMFLQLPPGWASARVAQLQAFLDFWPRELRLAVEVRHPQFFMEPYSTELNTLLRRYNVARVILVSNKPQDEGRVLACTSLRRVPEPPSKDQERK